MGQDICGNAEFWVCCFLSAGGTTLAIGVTISKDQIHPMLRVVLQSTIGLEVHGYKPVTKYLARILLMKMVIQYL